jgi:hypothetical protein
MQAENTTLERVTNYCNTLIRLLHPPDGTVHAEHFQIFPTEFDWTSDMPINCPKRDVVCCVNSVCFPDIVCGGNRPMRMTGLIGEGWFQMDAG